jgi:hypothetical protein
MFKKRKTTAYGMRSGSKALTLVESLVAISILVVSIFGPMVIISQAIRTAYFTRDQMTAFYLAQEPIEYVRNVRDWNSLIITDPAQWLVGVVPGAAPVINEDNAPNPTKYNLDMVINGATGDHDYQLLTCTGTGGACPKLNIDTVTRQYGADVVGGTVIPSIYTREVTFYKVPLTDSEKKEVVVEVVIKWSQGPGNFQYKAREYLKNWKLSEN